MAKTARLGFRLDPELKEAAQDVAESKGTTLTSLVVNYLRRLVAREEKKQDARQA